MPKADPLTAKLAEPPGPALGLVARVKDRNAAKLINVSRQDCFTFTLKVNCFTQEGSCSLWVSPSQR